MNYQMVFLLCWCVISVTKGNPPGDHFDVCKNNIKKNNNTIKKYIMKNSLGRSIQKQQNDKCSKELANYIHSFLEKSSIIIKGIPTFRMLDGIFHKNQCLLLLNDIVKEGQRIENFLQHPPMSDEKELSAFIASGKNIEKKITILSDTFSLVTRYQESLKKINQLVKTVRKMNRHAIKKNNNEKEGGPNFLEKNLQTIFFLQNVFFLQLQFFLLHYEENKKFNDHCCLRRLESVDDLGRNALFPAIVIKKTPQRIKQMLCDKFLLIDKQYDPFPKITMAKELSGVESEIDDESVVLHFLSQNDLLPQREPVEREHAVEEDALQEFTEHVATEEPMVQEHLTPVAMALKGDTQSSHDFLSSAGSSRHEEMFHFEEHATTVQNETVSSFSSSSVSLFQSNEAIQEGEVAKVSQETPSDCLSPEGFSLQLERNEDNALDNIVVLDNTAPSSLLLLLSTSPIPTSQIPVPQAATIVFSSQGSSTIVDTLFQDNSLQNTPPVPFFVISFPFVRKGMGIGVFSSLAIFLGKRYRRYYLSKKRELKKIL